MKMISNKYFTGEETVLSLPGRVTVNHTISVLPILTNYGSANDSH